MEEAAEEVTLANADPLWSAARGHLPGIDKREETTPADQASTGPADLHELGEPVLELIDCALRLAVCEKSPNLPAGVTITRDDVTRLATVSPALWRPNHLKPVSERTPFIPTIAHALSRSLIPRARSASLKRKAAEMLNRYPSACPHAERPCPPAVQRCEVPNSIYEAASIGLWNLLQRSDFGLGANVRLKSMNGTLRAFVSATNTVRGARETAFEELSGCQRPWHISTCYHDRGRIWHGCRDHMATDGRMLWEDTDSEHRERNVTPMRQAINELTSIFDDKDAIDEQAIDGPGCLIEPFHQSICSRSGLVAKCPDVRVKCEEVSLFETPDEIKRPLSADLNGGCLTASEMLFDEDMLANGMLSYNAKMDDPSLTWAVF